MTEHGLDPASITGTGKGGRITRGDVLSVIDRAAAGETTAAPSPPAAPPAPAAAAAAAAPRPAGGPARSPDIAATHDYVPVAGARDDVVPFTNIRRLTAEHMVRSKATSAHTLAVDRGRLRSASTRFARLTKSGSARRRASVSPTFHSSPVPSSRPCATTRS